MHFCLRQPLYLMLANSQTTNGNFVWQEKSTQNHIIEFKLAAYWYERSGAKNTK